MTGKMRGYIIVSFVSLIAISAGYAEAANEPINCDVLLHSKIPYEITMHGANNDQNSQIYRSDDYFITRLARMPDGKLSKIITQSMFVVSRSNSEFELDFRYDYINTNTNAFNYQPKFYDMTAEMHKGSEVRPAPFLNGRYFLEFFRNDVISLGPCVVPVVHFSRQKQANTYPYKENPKSEYWFSPDLGIDLRYIGRSFNKDGSVREVETHALNINTEFEPLKP